MKGRKVNLPAPVEAPTSFSNLQDLKSFASNNIHVFPSVASLRWFYRQHRDEMLEAHAVVVIAGRIMINAPVFANKAIEIGARTAKAL